MTTQLTSAQRAAATGELFGPSLVLAGPGTGKTQVMAHRIAHILQTTDTPPESILAISFTVAARAALRQRVATLVGSAVAARVGIFTFHGLANDLRDEFADDFESPATASPTAAADDLDSCEVALELLHSKPFAHLMHRHAPQRLKVAKGLVQAAGELYREGLRPEEFAQLVAKLRAEHEALPPEETINKRTGKKKVEVQKYEEKLEKWATLPAFAKAFYKTMDARGLLTFDRMMMEVITKLEADEDLRARALLERFLFVLVDEFQDTSGAQLRFLQLFSPEGAEAPNLCCVGDDDQAIYRFSGANVGNLLSFFGQFPGAGAHVIAKNFRSHAEILHLAEHISGDIGERLTTTPSGKQLEKKLEASKGGGGAVRLVECETPAHELIFVAEQVEKLWQAGERDVAVLTRRRADATRVAAALTSRGVPVAGSGGGNALDSPIVADVLAALRFADQPNQPEQLPRVLLSPGLRQRFDVCPSTLLAAMSRHGAKLAAALRAGEAGTELQRLLAALDELALENKRLRADQLAIRAAWQLGMFAAATSQTAEQDDAKSLSAVLEYLQQGTEDGRFQSLGQALSRLQRHQDMGVAISLPVSAGAGVHVGTAHSAKGLEFESVFIPGCNRKIWDNASKRGGGFPDLPPQTYRVNEPATKQQIQDDERRLFFVAMTRAKKRLVLTRSELSASGQATEKSAFLMGLSAQQLPTEKVQAKPSAVIQQLVPLERAKGSAALRAQVAAAVGAADFSLSHTSMEAYRKCPWRFVARHVLRFPTAQTLALAEGNAMHRAAELFFENADAAAAMQVYQQQLARQAIPAAEKEKALTEGGPFLERYLAARADVQAVRQEYPLRAVLAGSGARVFGKVDRIEKANAEGALRIVDMKNSKPKTPAECQDLAKSKSGLSRQVALYLLLARFSADFPEHPEQATVSAALDFVRPKDASSNEPALVEVAFTDQQLEEFAATIGAMWREITNLEFWDRPPCERAFGEEACAGCQIFFREDAASS